MPRTASAANLALSTFVLLNACSSSSGDASVSGSDAGRDDAKSTLDAKSTVDAHAHPEGSTEAGRHDGGSANDDASSDAGQPTSDGGSMEDGTADAVEGDSGPYHPVPVTTAISGLPDKEWTWVPLAGALCRDGSATGIGVNVNASSPNLMIFLEGGGSCDNASRCAGTPLNYDESDFTGVFAHGRPGTIFDRTIAASPVNDWNMVYIPYCTGDQHGGNNPGGHPADYDVPQQYVGYVDVALALARLVPTFPSVTKVLLTGDSAGGAGVQVNYLQTAQAFEGITVDALDDSGPPMPTPYLAACLQQYWGKLWRFDRTVLPICGAACDGPKGLALSLAEHMVSTYPSATFGVMDSIYDVNISHDYGYGENDCAAILADGGMPPRLSAATFAAGQEAIRTDLAAYSNFGTYLFPGQVHTTIETTAYATRTTSAEAGTVLFTSWLGSLIDGTVTNVGP